MMRSLFSAVSGLKTHQTRMDVIGNNIANVNTEAFKASSVRFSELMYQTLSTASGGDGALGTGGVNAKQMQQQEQLEQMLSRLVLVSIRHQPPSTLQVPVLLKQPETLSI